MTTTSDSRYESIAMPAYGTVTAPYMPAPPLPPPASVTITVMALKCKDCGSYVADKIVHEKFHDELLST